MLKYQHVISLGCDPEFFFSKKGKVIGSEKVLPENGLCDSSGYGKIVMDGVQAEINPSPSTCRASLGYNIRNCFTNIRYCVCKYLG